MPGLLRSSWQGMAFVSWRRQSWSRQPRGADSHCGVVAQLYVGFPWFSHHVPIFSGDPRGEFSLRAGDSLRLHLARLRSKNPDINAVPATFTIMLVVKKQHCQEVSSMTYWVCAFSINQHACICNSFGNPPVDQDDFQEWDDKRFDTVTGKVYPLCDCEERKIFTNEPNACELNKFHWMMRYLAEKLRAAWLVKFSGLNIDDLGILPTYPCTPPRAFGKGAPVLLTFGGGRRQVWGFHSRMVHCGNRGIRGILYFEEESPALICYAFSNSIRTWPCTM